MEKKIDRIDLLSRKLEGLDRRMKTFEAKILLLDVKIQEVAERMATKDEYKKELKELRDLILKMEFSLSTTPEWINTAKALKLLNIKDADTLNKYANQGLLRREKGCDNKNYYRTSEVLELPSKLIEDKGD